MILTYDSIVYKTFLANDHQDFVMWDNPRMVAYTQG